MLSTRGGNASGLREHNTRLILRSLLLGGPLSRRELSRQTDLVPGTVSNVVNDLINDRVLREVGPQPRPSGTRGPREVLVDFDATGVAAVSVALGIYTRSVGIVGPRGDVIASTGIQESSADATPAETLDWVEARINDLISESAIPASAIIGVGVSVEGSVDSAGGIQTHVPYRDWHDVPVVSDLHNRLGLPVTMANSVHAIASGELVFGRGGAGDSLLLVSVFTTIGCAAIAGRKVLAGPGRTAGDIGHITVVHDHGELCVCGKRGCLETIAGEYAIISAGRAAAWSGRSTHLLALSGGRLDAITVYVVAQAAVDGDPVAVTIVERAAAALAHVLAPLIGVLDPEAVVFDGVLPVLTNQIFMQPLRAALQSTLPPDRAVPVLTTCSVLETAFPADVSRPSMLGAAALAYERFFYSPQHGGNHVEAAVAVTTAEAAMNAGSEVRS
ncbi:MAG: ROK family transcriptional regulator [Thermomicrobiales bacterium]|nr:ROK family transcriptional regulator [Thermomicrobiales bacterium]